VIFGGGNYHVAMAENNICVILDRRGEFLEAKRHCQAAIDAHSPDFYYAPMTLGKINEKLGLIDASRQNFAESQRMRPDAGVRLHLATLLPLVYDSMADYNARHKGYVDAVAALVRDAAPLKFHDPLQQLVTVANFYLAFFGRNDAPTYTQLAQVVLQSARGVPGLAGRAALDYVAPHVQQYDAAVRAGALPARGGRPLRVGFVSMFFREHASGKMIQGIIRDLAQPEHNLHVTVFCIKERNDRKPYAGAVADRIRNAAHSYIELPKERGLEAWRATIEQQQLDVLVFAEIGMDPGNYLLAFSRLAPVQVATHGHASTTGVPTLEYYVSYAPFELPDAQAHYSEKLVTFSDFSPYYRPEVPADIPERAALLAELGLAPHVGPATTVYVCLQTLFKLVPDFDDVFKDILRRNPDSIIVFKQFMSPEINERLNRRLVKSIGKDLLPRIRILGNLPVRAPAPPRRAPRVPPPLT
jgi:protein O-GlcNAc transferase